MSLSICLFALFGCGPSESSVPSAEKHDLELVEAIPPTCTEEGNLEYYVCRDCGAVFIDGNEAELSETVLPALGHDYQVVESQVPTCLEGGYSVEVCSRCQDRKREEKDPLGHSPSAMPDIAPTCLEAGRQGGIECSRCHEILEEPTFSPALGHDFVDGVCSRCGQKRVASSGLEFTLQDDSTYELSGIGTCDDLDIVIPETYQGQSVTSIGYEAFYKEDITSVDIPSSVKTIEDRAFYYCLGLFAITFSEGLESIGYEAFYGASIVSVKLPDSLSSIDYGVFAFCRALESIEISEDNAYFTFDSGCLIEKESKKVVACCKVASIPDYVEEIGHSAFRGWNGKSITIGENVATIGEKAFSDCAYLSSVTFGCPSVFLGTRSFGNCVSLKELDLKGVRVFGTNCFKGCSNLKKLTVYPSAIDLDMGLDGVAIEELHFEGDMEQYLSLGSPRVSDNSPLKDGAKLYIDGTLIEGALAIPEGTASIPAFAFFNQRLLTSVSLPATLTKIGESAFYGCVALTEVFNASALDIKKDNSEHGAVGYYALSVEKAAPSPSVENENGFLTYLDLEGIAYICGYIGEEKDLVLPSSAQGQSYYIKPHAFSDADIESVAIGSGCLGIGKFAFYGSSLSSVSLDFAGEVGANAFSECESLSNLSLSKITAIGDSAFGQEVVMIGQEGGKLKEVVIPDSVKRIERWAFAGQPLLEKVSFGKGLEYIGVLAFNDCDALASAVFEVKTGWKVSDGRPAYDISVNVSNPSSAAKMLRETYIQREWIR